MKIKAKMTSASDLRWYSPETNWGTFCVKVLEIIEKADNDLPLDINNKLKIAGNIPFKPEVDVEYLFEGNYYNDAKWGLQFELISGHEDIKLETPEDKRAFLEQILTEKQIENLYNIYEDPFIIIEQQRITDLMKVDGIGEYLAQKIFDRFNATKDLAPAFAFFGPLGLTSKLISKLCYTYKGAKEAIEKFKENPYMLADDVDGVGFIKADEIAKRYKFDIDHPFRIRAGITYLLKDNAQSNGSTWMKSSTFRTKIVKLLGIEFNKVLPTFGEMVKSGDIYISKEREQIALQYYRDLEEKIKAKLIELLEADNEAKEDITEEMIEQRIKETEEAQGFEFTDEQRQGIKEVINNNVVVVIGLAGTGKTSVIKGAYNIFSSTTNISQCAFSGQASKRINEATGYPSSTIHRLLGYRNGEFEHDTNYPLFTDVVVLDEVSMVGLELFWSLIQAIPNGAKLIMLGDNGQLPPIGVGNLLSDLISSKVIPLVELTKIHRQAAKSAIITTSQKIRQRKMLLEPEYEGDEVLGELQDLYICARQEREDLFDLLIDTFMEEYNNNNHNVQDVQIIVAQNKKVALSREKINAKIQELINPHINNEKSIKISNKQVARVGDKVINRKNCYDVNTIDGEEASIFNGSMGIIQQIGQDSVIIDFFDEGLIVLKQDKFFGLELAYAITCHSSQGSQFKTVIVGFDYSSFIMLSNEWLYTALTRAKKKCYIIAETKAINTAATNNKILGRRTFLPELFGKTTDDDNVVYEGE